MKLLLEDRMKKLKKTLFVFIAIAMLLTAVGCSSKKDEPVVGGWQTVEDGTITEELQELFDDAMKELDGVGYKPLRLLETQVVAGTNYRFLCDATVIYPDAETKQAIVTIYKDLEGNVSILEIEDAE